MSPSGICTTDVRSTELHILYVFKQPVVHQGAVSVPISIYNLGFERGGEGAEIEALNDALGQGELNEQKGMPHTISPVSPNGQNQFHFSF